MFLSEFPCSSTSGIGESGHRTQAKMQFEGIYRKFGIRCSEFGGESIAKKAKKEENVVKKGKK